MLLALSISENRHLTCITWEQQQQTEGAPAHLRYECVRGPLKSASVIETEGHTRASR